MGFLRALLLLLFAKPIAYLVLGFSVVHGARLLRRGPAIIAANHNSHLDTLLLFSLFPLRLLPKLRPVAAADYFMRGRLRKWFARRIVGIVPVDRNPRAHGDPLRRARAALRRGDILFVFPEGSRGTPERMASLKSGIAHLAQAFPTVPVQPVFLQGAGRSLPKGSRLFVPYRCHGVIGEPFSWNGDRKAFMHDLGESFASLAREAPRLDWEEEEATS